jgi:hypothetical protein
MHVHSQTAELLEQADWLPGEKELLEIEEGSWELKQSTAISNQERRQRVRQGKKGEEREGWWRPHNDLRY